ncbi:hypothetical protein JAAARDRAFT_189780 [Jaapia argillacea MUCL 33604]|uniref:Uncharacterized protein n=1 Tax=Jaapia argillacea MUCL 33604 TaxID=933084 RepID=A0A067QIP2_9AGAM|nr:hypothetical protein JAAARDRAFT_189780 [Jaapia argillacea MUCL 33604]
MGDDSVVVDVNEALVKDEEREDDEDDTPDIQALKLCAQKLQWTVVVPHLVIMELNGLSSSNTPELAHAASAALFFITSITLFSRSLHDLYPGG